MAQLRDEYGNPIQMTDEHGHPVQLTDEFGNPMHLTGIATTATTHTHPTTTIDSLFHGDAPFNSGTKTPTGGGHGPHGPTHGTTLGGSYGSATHGGGATQEGTTDYGGAWDMGTGHGLGGATHGTTPTTQGGLGGRTYGTTTKPTSTHGGFGGGTYDTTTRPTGTHSGLGGGNYDTTTKPTATHVGLGGGNYGTTTKPTGATITTTSTTQGGLGGGTHEPHPIGETGGAPITHQIPPPATATTGGHGVTYNQPGGGEHEKKGLTQKIKEKLSGGKHGTDTTETTTTTAGEHHEKKGVMEKIKEKLPGHHNH